jgi:hypothetical protein
MLKDPIDRPEADAPVKIVEKMRRCLMCSLKFMSRWSGERVCPKCKQSDRWKAG